jgi:Alkyl sulfatase C-terminal
MMGAKTLDAQMADGTAKLQGNASTLQQLASTMVDFDTRFEIMPGTKSRGTEVARTDPYTAVPRQTIGIAPL